VRYHGGAMTDLEMDSAGDYIGQCPNEPEDPISFEAYERVIAAMEKMCAEAPPSHRTAPLAPRSPRTPPHPPSTRRAIRRRRRA
jgi:hypothetical protein